MREISTLKIPFKKKSPLCMVTDKIERPGQLQAFLFTMQYSNAGITNYTSSILHM